MLDVHMRRLPNHLVSIVCLMIVKEWTEKCKKLVRNLQSLLKLGHTNILQFQQETTERLERPPYRFCTMEDVGLRCSLCCLQNGALCHDSSHLSAIGL
jgi:hypothetical protein